MTITKGRIIPNDSSEARSVLDVHVVGEPPLKYDFLLVAFDIGNGQTAHNTVEKSIVQGLDAGEISRMQAKGGDVTCEWEIPRQHQYHLTAIKPA
jgi:hypothetical protein